MNKVAFNDVEIFLRLNGRLPEKETDHVGKEEYKKYCDMVMKQETFPRDRKYEPDGLWQYAWDMYKNL